MLIEIPRYRYTATLCDTETTQMPQARIHKFRLGGGNVTGGRATEGHEYRVAEGHQGLRSGYGCPVHSRGKAWGVCRAPSHKIFEIFHWKWCVLVHFTRVFEIQMPIA